MRKIKFMPAERVKNNNGGWKGALSLAGWGGGRDGGGASKGEASFYLFAVRRVDKSLTDKN